MTETSTKVPKQRVTKNLGKNQTKDHDILYTYIENTLCISHKPCSMGNKGNKYNIVHQGDRNLPIREFRLHKIRTEDGKIVCEKNIPLQGNCITCDDQWRKARLEDCENKFKNMTYDDIREHYKKKYETDTKMCSCCKKEKSVNDYNISKRMECGLHNMCLDCTKLYTSSCADRNIIYMTDGNSTKIKKTKNMSDDHIFPIALGGCMLSDRFQYLLEESINNQLSIDGFKISMSKAICKDIEDRKLMTDEELRELYTAWNKKNNTRFNIKRCITKFREYCSFRFD